MEHTLMVIVIGGAAALACVAFSLALVVGLRAPPPRRGGVPRRPPTAARAHGAKGTPPTPA